MFRERLCIADDRFGRGHEEPSLARPEWSSSSGVSVGGSAQVGPFLRREHEIVERRRQKSKITDKRKDLRYTTMGIACPLGQIVDL